MSFHHIFKFDFVLFQKSKHMSIVISYSICSHHLETIKRIFSSYLDVNYWLICQWFCIFVCPFLFLWPLNRKFLCAYPVPINIMRNRNFDYSSQFPTDYLPSYPNRKHIMFLHYAFSHFNLRNMEITYKISVHVLLV